MPRLAAYHEDPEEDDEDDEDELLTQNSELLRRLQKMERSNHQSFDEDEDEEVEERFKLLSAQPGIYFDRANDAEVNDENEKECEEGMLSGTVMLYIFFNCMFYQLLRVQHSCSSTQSWGSLLPSIVETRDQNSPPSLFE